ncbi:MAG: methionyl-tRNA formyltransferase [Candidatus Magnetoglobus multicellularis str. Araruama]|uniref:methionyl-tRNA formyltransferase n=1 Tax=Candidatus Magnetoglobus multicellularis str. Araruama TaxID=890399 RepID=A0A1V1PBU9_9BACT|nr:MAG: methionyl-tRNA formyltransferase [Candidatus Magnetoglobus multicellularis str. Araruama]
MGLDIIQPQSINSKEYISILKSLDPDYLVVVAFGQLLKKAVLDIPSKSVLNVHPSLLPQYRGPAPIQWSIIHGCSKTGISIMQLDEGLDTGDILQIETVSIDPKETAGMLHDRLAKSGASLLVDTIDKLSEQRIQSRPQDHSFATYARLLTKKDGLIQWQQPTQSIINFIRGMTPWPGAYTYLNNKRLKIFMAEKADATQIFPPGTVLEAFPDELWIATGDGALSILNIQSASGKQMSVADYLRGNTIVAGTQAQNKPE